jgi:hypothetical protein
MRKLGKQENLPVSSLIDFLQSLVIVSPWFKYILGIFNIKFTGKVKAIPITGREGQ